MNSSFFVFKISLLPNYHVQYYDYIVKLCNGIACDWCASLDISYILALRTAHLLFSRLFCNNHSSDKQRCISVWRWRLRAKVHDSLQPKLASQAAHTAVYGGMPPARVRAEVSDQETTWLSHEGSRSRPEDLLVRERLFTVCPVPSIIRQEYLFDNSQAVIPPNIWVPLSIWCTWSAVVERQTLSR